LKKILLKIRLLTLASGTGAAAGSVAALFITSLNFVTQIFVSNKYFLFGLPLAGFLIGWSFTRFGQGVHRGLSLIMEEIHEPSRRIPLRLTPMIFVGTLLTHIVGGSSGREGTVVQMGGGLADALGRIFRVPITERKSLLIAGMAAGFGTAVGAPWAGVVFGLEVLTVGRLRFFAALECLIAVLTGSFVFSIWGVQHTNYFVPQIPLLNRFVIEGSANAGLSLDIYSLGQFISALFIAALAFGLCARFFVWLIHGLEMRVHRWIVNPSYRPMLGGVALLVLFSVEGSFRYCGLGLEVIQDSLKHTASFIDPILKFIFTSITLAFGFKGGEFIPLVFIGSTLGSALGPILHLDSGFLAALGFAATFGAAANVPIACTVMAIELFGAPIAPFAALVGFVSYLCSGSAGIYKGQRS
jgi:H+/Cl- antiporter ClcA